MERFYRVRPPGRVPLGSGCGAPPWRWPWAFCFLWRFRGGPQNREKICKLLIKISPIRRWSIV